jgi:hypothetical protein
VKNLSFSLAMNLSRFSEPFSSIPSKHIFMLTWHRGQLCPFARPLSPPALRQFAPLLDPITHIETRRRARIPTHGKRNTEVFVRLQHVEPAHHRSLVIGRASPVELPRALRVAGELEGRVEPPVLLERGLDVVVAIDKEGFLCRCQ